MQCWIISQPTRAIKYCSISIRKRAINWRGIKAIFVVRWVIIKNGIIITNNERIDVKHAKREVKHIETKCSIETEADRKWRINWKVVRQWGWIR